MPHANTTTTLVRTAVARFESTCATPTLARRAVAAANTADRSAQPIQLLVQLFVQFMAIRIRGALNSRRLRVRREPRLQIRFHGKIIFQSKSAGAMSLYERIVEGRTTFYGLLDEVVEWRRDQVDLNLCLRFNFDGFAV